jgi:dolichyl-phosphate mannosyltransferase polypeptide 3
MTRATRFLTIAIPLFIAYLLALWHIFPVPILSAARTDELLPVVCSGISLAQILINPSYYPRFTPPFRRTGHLHCRPQLPWWLLVTFGAYSLSSLGLGLVRFHDCPEAYESLLSEITQAKNELRNQGVSVD